MAFIVEDGSGVSGANQYIDITFYDAWLVDNGFTDARDDADKDQSIFNATLSLDSLYGPNYLSNKYTSTQGLLWPRAAFEDNYGDAIDETTIHIALKNACALLTLENVSTSFDLFPQPNNTDIVSEESKGLGTLKKSVKYRSDRQVESYSGFARVDQYLYPILGSTTVTRLARG